MKSSTSAPGTVWTEIPVADFNRARQFYEFVFTVELRVHDLGALKMGVFPEEAFACAICHHEQFYYPGEQGPVVYFNGGEDLTGYLDRVSEAGGEVLIPKRAIGDERGYMAIFRDTEGNRIGLMSPQ